MNDMKKINQDEKKLLNDLENGVYIDKPLSDTEIKEYQKYAKNTQELNFKKYNVR